MEVKTMSKKELIKKYLEEHKYEMIRDGIITAIIGAYGVCCLELGAGGALKEVAKRFTAVSGMNGDPTIYEVTGNAFKGFSIDPRK